MKYIQNVTDAEKFPIPQNLAYKEAGKGNVIEKISKSPGKYQGYDLKAIKTIMETKQPIKSYLKFKNMVLIEPGEKIETNLNGENVYGEPRLHFVNEGKKPSGGK